MRATDVGDALKVKTLRRVINACVPVRKVASDALALRAYTEFAERIQLHRLAFLNRRSDLLEKIF